MTLTVIYKKKKIIQIHRARETESKGAVTTSRTQYQRSGDGGHADGAYQGLHRG